MPALTAGPSKPTHAWSCSAERRLVLLPLNDDELTTFRRLTSQIGQDRSRLERLNAYYEGVQRLEQLGLAVPPELRRFTTVVNWPRVVADSVEERLDVEGFRLSGQTSPDDDLWRVWQANDLDEDSQLAHLDALVYGRSYVCVGANEEDADTPLVTIESPTEMVTESDPRTRRVSAALKVYGREGKNLTSPAQYATLYLPDVTIWLERPTRGGRWDEVDRDEHGLGVVPVVPLVNRARTSDRQGVSEMADVINLTDAASRALTNAQLATETLAVPKRFVLNASKGDFVDQNGNMLTAWEAYFGVFSALSNKDADVKQLPAADLGNFEKIVNHYGALVSSTSGLPMRFLGQQTTNPPSADGIRADETRLVKKCERKSKAWSGSWEQVMRLVRRIQTGEYDPALQRMETKWRNPATPTEAQQADAVVKLHGAGILPTEGAWEELHYSPEKVKHLRDLREAEALDPIAARILREVNDGGDVADVGA